MIKTSPSNAGGASPIPTQEARILYAVQPKDQNNIVTQSIKTLKMVHIKKKKKTLKNKEERNDRVNY